MVGIKGGARNLYIRRLDNPAAKEVTDTSGINCAFFSPDSASVVFIGSTSLTRLSLADGQRKVITSDSDNSTAITWSSPGILFSRGGTLWIVSPQGGEARQLTKLDSARHEVLHTDPLVLPGGRVVLFSSLTNEFGTERIEAISLETGRRWVVMERAITRFGHRQGICYSGEMARFWQYFLTLRLPHLVAHR